MSCNFYNKGHEVRAKTKLVSIYPSHSLATNVSSVMEIQFFCLCELFCSSFSIKPSQIKGTCLTVFKNAWWAQYPITVAYNLLSSWWCLISLALLQPSSSSLQDAVTDTIKMLYTTSCILPCIHPSPSSPSTHNRAKTENPLPFFLSGSHKTNFDALY